MEMTMMTTSTGNPSTASNGDTLGFHRILTSAVGRPDLCSLASVVKLNVRGVIHAVEASRILWPGVHLVTSSPLWNLRCILEEKMYFSPDLG